jgi:hypothetical protein
MDTTTFNIANFVVSNNSKKIDIGLVNDFKQEFQNLIGREFVASDIFDFGFSSDIDFHGLDQELLAKIIKFYSLLSESFSPSPPVSDLKELESKKDVHRKFPTLATLKYKGNNKLEFERSKTMAAALYL